MHIRYISLTAAFLAVIAGAVAYIMDGMSREECARAEVEKAAALEAAAASEARAARAEAEKAADEKRKAELNAQAAKTAKEASEAEARAQADAKVAAEENAKAKADQLKAAEIEREAAQERRKAEADKLKASETDKEAARARENAEALKAQAEADRLESEKLRSEKVIAEAKALELMKIDFETWQRDLIELEQELSERERALKPEKTIADLAWVGGGEDMEVGEGGMVKVKKRREYRAEDDMTLPRPSRDLARAERRISESMAENTAQVRSRIIKRLESMYVAALKEDRVVDAGFYRASLKSLYPDWEPKPEEDKTDIEESEKKKNESR